MGKDPHEWTPDRIKKILKAFEKNTVDTSSVDDIDPMRIIGGAEVLPGNQLLSWHVTDDPAVMIRALDNHVDLQTLRPWGDLCGGFYVSSFPDVWRGRSRRKWEFMQTLSLEASKRLAHAVLERLHHDRDVGRITQSEFQRGRHDIEHYWLVNGNFEALLNLSILPYAINIQKIAKEEGIADPFEPAIVDVVFQGRYLHVTQDVRRQSAELAAKFLDMEQELVEQEQICQTWKALGWDGAFTKAGMGTNPELVIWNMDRILKFGPWTKGR